MKISISGIVFMLAACLLYGQQPVSQVGYKRQLSAESPVYQASGFVEQHTVLIAEGKVWINGNLIKPSSIPQSLKDPNLFLQITFLGSNEFEFSLYGKEYLVKHGNIIEMKPPVQAEVKTAEKTSLSKSDYYNSLKNETPDIFTALRREAELYEQCLRLAMDYQAATDPQKSQVQAKLRVKLEELFDLSRQNQLREVLQLEQDIKVLKGELSFRNKNKDQIIDKHLEDLLNIKW